MKTLLRLVLVAGLVVAPAESWQKTTRAEFTTKPLVWMNSEIEGGKLRVAIVSQGPAAPRISIVVKSTDENYSKLTCVAIERGESFHRIFHIQAMGPIADCAKPVSGQLNLEAPQDPKAAYAIYVELSREIQLELSWNETAVFSGKVEATFGWSVGRSVEVPLSNGGAYSLILAASAGL